MIKRKILITIIIVGVLLVGAVGGILLFYPYPPNKPPKADETGFTKEGISMVSNANNEFALDLYKNLSKDGNENLFFSPYSIFSAMAMVYEGSKGKTEEEMRDVFYFPHKEKLRTNFAKIYNLINRGGREIELRTGNALWLEKTYPVLDSYKEVIERFYGGKVENLDFINETEKSRKIINKFIEDQTNKRIKNLIPEGVLDKLTRLVITNAIYFKGEWKYKFKKSDTKERDFYITPEEKVKVPMMYMKPEKANFNYAETEKAKILELSYRNERISMLIILPKWEENYTLKDVERELNYKNLKKWEESMKKTKISAIYLPKFRIETKYFLKKNLQEMGIKDVFSINGDMSGISGKRDLFVSNVIHKAFVEVNEEGTEAAAATAVVIRLTAIPDEIVFKANHPFIFIIKDKETGCILFMGKLVKPES